MPHSAAEETAEAYLAELKSESTQRTDYSKAAAIAEAQARWRSSSQWTKEDMTRGVAEMYDSQMARTKERAGKSNASAAFHVAVDFATRGQGGQGGQGGVQRGEARCATRSKRARDDSEVDSEYERQRKDNIANNQDVMRQLGLV